MYTKKRPNKDLKKKLLQIGRRQEDRDEQREEKKWKKQEWKSDGKRGGKG